MIFKERTTKLQPDVKKQGFEQLWRGRFAEQKQDTLPNSKSTETGAFTKRKNLIFISWNQKYIPLITPPLWAYLKLLVMMMVF